jgi:lysophospholipase L1-like esterase
MKYLLIILLFTVYGNACQKKNTIQPMVVNPAPGNNTGVKSFTYLALGDSYTVGHGLPPEDNYPNQTISLLKKDNLNGAVRIIATTGWTTTDLKNGIQQAESNGALLHQYDIVTLLIGVNNEYQGMPVDIYKTEFELILKKAISFASNKAAHVIVLSIPDWGVTPFASGRNREEISKEIDTYNLINKDFAGKYGVNYVDITPWTREAANDLSLLAPDQLHPSGKEYARWAESLERIIKNLQGS